VLAWHAGGPETLQNTSYRDKDQADQCLNWRMDSGEPNWKDALRNVLGEMCYCDDISVYKLVKIHRNVHFKLSAFYRIKLYTNKTLALRSN
jgi:hypothetical protein